MGEENDFEKLIGAVVVGFHTHKCHNGCSAYDGDESEPMEDGVIVEKDGKRYVISVVYCFDVPVEVEESEECLQLSVDEEVGSKEEKKK